MPVDIFDLLADDEIGDGDRLLRIAGVVLDDDLDLAPLTPPASLIATAAVSASRFICSPMPAMGPVIGPATPMVISLAKAGAARAESPSAVSGRIRGLRLWPLPCFTLPPQRAESLFCLWG